MISDSLKPSSQCAAAARKANQVLGQIIQLQGQFHLDPILQGVCSTPTSSMQYKHGHKNTRRYQSTGEYATQSSKNDVRSVR